MLSLYSGVGGFSEPEFRGKKKIGFAPVRSPYNDASSDQSRHQPYRSWRAY